MHYVFLEEYACGEVPYSSVVGHYAHRSAVVDLSTTQIEAVVAYEGSAVQLVPSTIVAKCGDLSSNQYFNVTVLLLTLWRLN